MLDDSKEVGLSVFRIGGLSVGAMTSPPQLCNELIGVVLVEEARDLDPDAIVIALDGLVEGYEDVGPEHVDWDVAAARS